MGGTDGSLESGELQPILEPELGWSKAQSGLLSLCVFAYIFCYVPMALPSALLPSIEDDAALGWTPLLSGVYVSSVGWAQCVGHIVVGGAADLFGGTQVLLGYLFLAGLGIMIISSQESPTLLIVTHSVVAFLKGCTWPAVSAVMGRHLHGSQCEVGIVVIAMASRLGDALTSEAFAMLLKAYDWRDALKHVGWTLAVVAVCLHVLSSRMPTHAVNFRSPSDEGSQKTSRLSDIFCDYEFWLWTIFCACGEMGSVFASYLGAFAHKLYNTSESDSDFVNGALPSGQFVSLAISLLILFISSHRRKTIHIWSVVLMLAAIVAPLILLSTERIGVNLFTGLAFAFGFCVVIGGYVPTTVYFICVGRITGDVAFRTGVVSGLGGLVGQAANLYVGYTRQQDELMGFRLVCWMNIVSPIICSMVLMQQISQHWNGYLSEDNDVAT